MKTIRRTTLSIIGILLLCSMQLTAAEAADTSANTPAVQGVIDLRQQPFDKGTQQVSLQGEWAFYPQRLLTPAELRHAPDAPVYAQVPSTWPQSGYGTYRLRLLIPKSDYGASKALVLRSVNSASRIWIDGSEMGGLGTVGTSRAAEQPRSHMNMIFFQPKQPVVDIVIQASNFSFREGGITREVIYGDTKALIPYLLKELLYVTVTIGGFMLIGLYHLLVYGMRKRDRSALFVGLVALAIAIRTLLLNEYLSSVILGLRDWELLVKLEYIVELAALLFVALLMRQLYPQEVHRSMIRLSLAVAAGLCLFVLLTPARVFTDSMLPQTIVKGSMLLYFICYVGIRAYLQRREGAFIHMIALVLIVAAIINDTLYYLHLADTMEWIGYSTVPFIMAQAAIVSYRHAKLSDRNDVLLEELSISNKLLERRVEDRTRSLHEANAQRSHMLAAIAHDLGTPLTAFQTHLKLIVSGKVPPSRLDIHEQMLSKATYMRHLVQDLFEMSKLESGKMNFHYEQVRVAEWAEEIVDALEAELREKEYVLQARIDLDDAEHSLSCIRIDRTEMMRVMRNLIDNAYKFSVGIHSAIELRMGVRVHPVTLRDVLAVEVTDRGAGMTEEVRSRAFERFYRARAAGAEGSGLGLAIAKEIVERHQGEVGAISALGEGSTFYFLLPIVK